MDAVADRGQDRGRRGAWQSAKLFRSSTGEVLAEEYAPPEPRAGERAQLGWLGLRRVPSTHYEVGRAANDALTHRIRVEGISWRAESKLERYREDSDAKHGR
jgi:hypothetical protein